MNLCDCVRQLKGHPVKKLQQEVNRMIGVLRLEEKRNVYSRKLSGGLKRKLSVGIALIAGSKVSRSSIKHADVFKLHLYDADIQYDTIR